MPSFLCKCLHVQNKNSSRYTVIKLFCAKSAQSTTSSCQMLGNQNYSINHVPQAQALAYSCVSLCRCSRICESHLQFHWSIMRFCIIWMFHDIMTKIYVYVMWVIWNKILINYSSFRYHYQVTCRWSKLTLLPLSSCL